MRGEKPEIEALLTQEKWNEERWRLREIILGCGLDEAIKWGKLCYSFKGGNVAIIFGLKSYCAVGFFKGALLSDKKALLVAPGDHSQAMRQMRFSGLDEITDAEAGLKAYLKEAIQVEEDGREVEFSEKDDLTYPGELQEAFDRDPGYAAAFAALTPGRQRGYIIHFSGAKQSKTRESRINGCRSQIIAGKGLNGR